MAKIEAKVRALFLPGTCVATNGAVRAFQENNINPQVLLAMHVKGLWGIVCDEDKEENEHSLKYGGRIMSAYLLEDEKTKIWVITEACRSYTTFLLPSEY